MRGVPVADAPNAPRPPSEAGIPSGGFTTLLSKEIERSRRYYRGFGLLRVRWASARRARVRGGGESAAAEAVARSLRRADLVAPAPGGGLFILLPETPASGVPVVSRRVEEVLARARAGEESSPQVSQAAYPRDGESAGELLSAVSGTDL
jgi:hypothetical protein